MNFLILQFFVLSFLLPFIGAIPLPRIITRVHTADPVTTTQTYTTGTTTVRLPTIELFISNGVTFTRTLTDQFDTTQATTTSIYNDPTTTPAAETTAAAATTPAAQDTTTPAAAQVPTISTGVSPTTGQVVTSTTATDAPTTAATTSTSPATTQATTQATTSSTQQNGATTTTSSETLAGAGSPTDTATTTSSSTGTATTSSTSSTKNSPSSSTAGSTSTSSSSGSISPPNYIVYSPYTDNGGCKDADSIQTDLNLIASKGIKNLRLYGTDCATISLVLPKAAALGMKVNQGFWFGNGAIDDVDSMVTDIVNYAQANTWDVFDYFTVGNEAINEGYCTVSSLISKIAEVKSTLKKNGFTGYVTTSEPPISWINNPSLCTDSDVDIVGINPHSYFNANLYAYQAGSYIVEQKGEVESVCGSKKVLITETGYPSQGDTNGNNVPSADNQYQAIKSIIEETGGDVTILTTYNDFWKNPGPYGIEQYFGTITLFS